MLLGAQAHKTYISIANLEYNKAKEQIEVSLQLTAHDFEEVIARHFGKKLSWKI